MAYQLSPLRSHQRLGENMLAHLLLRLFSLDKPEADVLGMKQRMQQKKNDQTADDTELRMLQEAEDGLAFIARLREQMMGSVAAMSGDLPASSVDAMTRLAQRRAAPYGAYFIFGSGVHNTTPLQLGIGRMVQACQIDQAAWQQMIGLLHEGWLVEAHQREHEDHKMMRGYKVEYHLSGHHGAYWHPKEFEEFLVQGGPLTGCNVCRDVSALYSAQGERAQFEVCWDCAQRINRGAAIRNCDHCGRPLLVDPGEDNLLCVECRMTRVALA